MSKSSKTITDNQLLKLNHIADYILAETDVDVRKNTKSRSSDLPKYRALFFVLALSNVNISYGSLGSFLNKDHASINHALKIWDNEVYRHFGVYLSSYEPIVKLKSIEKESILMKRRSGKMSQRETISHQSKEILELKEQIKDLRVINQSEKHNNVLKIKQLKSRNVIKNKHLLNLLSKDEEIIEMACNTRIKPFLKMLESRVVYSKNILKAINK